MARSDLVQMEGVVKEVMVGGNFRVEVDGGHNVLAQLAGNMRRNRIRVVLGDSGDRRGLALRSDARSHRLPRQVASPLLRYFFVRSAVFFIQRSTANFLTR